MDLAHARAVLAVVLSLLLVTLGVFLLGYLTPVALGVIVGALVVLGAVTVLVADDPSAQELPPGTTSWDRMATDQTLLNTRIANRGVSQQPRIRNREGRV